MKKYVVALFAAAALMTGCSSEDLSTVSGGGESTGNTPAVTETASTYAVATSRGIGIMAAAKDKGKDWKTAYGHYLETALEEMAWLGDFDIFGHYDYVARYAPYQECSILYKDFPDILDGILKYLAENGKALEINTKTYQEYNGRTPVLDRDIFLRFKEMGGEAISLGSDSHNPERVGENFLRFSAFIESCGFRYTAHFKSRRLIMEKI